MASGRISFYDDAKKYGFIRTDDGEDLFYHLTSFRGPESVLNRDTRVEFEVADGNEKRRKAINIRLDGDAAYKEDFNLLYRTAYTKLKARRMLTDDEVDEIIFYLPIPSPVDG